MGVVVFGLGVQWDLPIASGPLKSLSSFFWRAVPPVKLWVMERVFGPIPLFQPAFAKALVRQAPIVSAPFFD
ncbi:TPA: hypothetical protein DCE37_09760 [Candidatus Latescibacteria bacterium]|nr:hypothetical protein [Candidatus Latescibacterota bacterium]